MEKILNRQGMPLLGLSDLFARMRRVAAPEYAIFSFYGLVSQALVPVDVYYSDVADALINFDGGAGASATSPTSYTAMEDLLLVDVAIVTGGTDTKKLQLLRGNQPVGGFIRHTLHLTSVAMRSPLKIGFRRGVEIRAIQKA